MDDAARDLARFVTRDDVARELGRWREWRCVTPPRNVVRFASRAVVRTLKREDQGRTDVAMCVGVGEILASAASVTGVASAVAALRAMGELERCATWASEGRVHGAACRVMARTGHPHWVALGSFCFALKEVDAGRLTSMMATFAELGKRARCHGHEGQFFV